MAVTGYVDGLSLYYSGVRNTPYRWLDVPALLNEAVPNEYVSRVHYAVSIDPRPIGQERQRAYLDALHTMKQMRIHEASPYDPVRLLGELMVAFANNQEIALLVSNDVRLIPYIHEAKARGTKVGIVHLFEKGHPAVRGAGTFIKNLRHRSFQACLLGDPCNGVVKPATW